MVNPGGKSTMLGHWRIVVRQAEEAARSGRLDEALALVSRPDVADHQQAMQLRGRLALDVLARAARRAEADDLAGALDDLQVAERYGVAPDSLAAARLRVADCVAAEVRQDLDAGQPERVAERIEHLARHKVGGPALRRMREAAEAWQAALAEGRRGEFGRALEHLDRAERLAGESAQAALAAVRRDLDARQQAAHPRVEALYQALAGGRWAEVLSTAEAILMSIPEHPAALQARSRAWQQIAAIHPSVTLPHRGGDGPGPGPAAPRRPGPNPAEPAPRDVVTVAAAPTRIPNGAGAAPTGRIQPPAGEPGPRGRFLLWADAIGGYLVCLDPRIVLGRAGPDSPADVPLLGDLSRDHATLIRDGDAYVVRANHPTFVNGRRVESAPLRDGDVLRLGPTVELEFRQPSPVSATARLAILSRHRLPLAVDGVILMAETCIVGASSQAHVPAPGLTGPVVLYRQGPALWCRAPGAFEVDGRACVARAPLTLQSSVLGEGFSFSLEPLGSHASSA